MVLECSLCGCECGWVGERILKITPPLSGRACYVRSPPAPRTPATQVLLRHVFPTAVIERFKMTIDAHKMK